jgi:hypothetical protein
MRGKAEEVGSTTLIQQIMRCPIEFPEGVTLLFNINKTVIYSVP